MAMAEGPAGTKPKLAGTQAGQGNWERSSRLEGLQVATDKQRIAMMSVLLCRNNNNNETVDHGAGCCDSDPPLT